ncbi:class I glutamine amidotransferase-like protein [Exidia glandulosa HHB12029]|uniref:Class I glutamine amidotransferase-like protein n=1 Tax=Exidia glandulosa HHB12029 TaxID=1314781 RepID=A0A165E8X9_EXIGL|nr:class I glutamine amidotransferase-like protein [Exidia glandulosa HHB12029]
MKQFVTFALTAAAFVHAQDAVPPVNIGYVVFPSFQALDVFGPLDPLNMLSMTVPLNLSIIAGSLDPVNTRPVSMATPSFFGESIVPSHTFADPPKNLDVLIVPGGLGTRAPIEQLQPAIDFIKTQYPDLKYLISVCTGATLLARAGVLDGRRATSNKAAWAFVKSTGPNVEWVPQARWVVDGNIWTTSGVAAGIDGIFAWIGHVWGEDTSLRIANLIEYERHTDPSWDPFAIVWNTTGTASAPAASAKLLPVIEI